MQSEWQVSTKLSVNEGHQSLKTFQKNLIKMSKTKWMKDLLSYTRFKQDSLFDSTFQLSDIRYCEKLASVFM